MFELLFVLTVLTGSLCLGVLLERYSPNVGAGLLPETPADVVAWREEQDRRAER